MTTKIAMVMIAAIDDGSWGSAGFSGLRQIDNLLDVETFYAECLPPAEWETAIREFAAMECDLVLVHGAELSEEVRTVAQEFPSVLFACVNGAYTSRNLASFSMDDEALGYLAGALAARMSSSGVVGHIGGLRIPTTEAQAYGFEQGASASGVEVLTTFIGEFSDPGKAREAATRQSEHGVDVFYYYLKEAGKGVLEVCKEQGLHAIGAITDQQYLAPEVIYSSALQNVGLLHLMAAQLAIKGQLEGRRYRIGLEDPDAQGLTPFHNVPKEVVRELRSIRERILSGELEIPRIQPS